MKRFLKIAAISLAVLILILLALLGALQTPWVKNLIVAKAETALSTSLGARVSIGRLSGVIPWTLNLDDLTLQIEGDEKLLHIDRIETGVQPFAVLARTIRITKLHIRGMDANLRREPDGTWNFQPIIDKFSGGEPGKPTKPAQKSGGIEVEVLDAGLADASIHIDNKEIPQSKPLDVALAFKGSYRDGAATLDNLSVTSQESFINASGKFSPSAPPDLRLNIDVKDLADITRHFLAPPMRGSIQGDLRVAALEPVPVLDGTLRIQDFSGLGAGARLLNLTMKGDTSSHVSQVELSGSDISYNDLVIREIKLTSGLSPETLTLEASASGDPDLQLAFAGKLDGLTRPQKEISVSKLRLGMRDSFWDAAEPIKVTYKPDGVTIESLTLVQKDQKISLRGTAQFEGENDLTVDLENINVGDNLRLFQLMEDVEGILSMRARLAGSGAKPRMEGELHLTGAKWEGVELSHTDLNFKYADELATVECVAQAPGDNALRVTGRIPIRLSPQSSEPLFPASGLDLSVDAKKFSLALLEKFVPQLKEVQARADLTAHLTGAPLDPAINGALDLQGEKLEFKDIPYPYAIRELSAKAEFNRDEISLRNLSFKAGEQGSVALQGGARLKNFIPQTYNFILQANRLPAPPSEGFKVELGADLNVHGSLDTIAMEGSLQLEEVTRNYLWKTQQPLSVELGPGGVHVRSLALVNGDQKLDLSGVLSTSQKSDLTVKLEKIGLLSNLQLFGIKNAPTGDVSADISLTGESAAPRIDGRIEVHDLKYSDAPAAQAGMDIHYADKLAELSGAVTVGDGNALSVKGKAPINLALETDEPRIPRSGLDLSIQGKKLDLALLEKLVSPLQKVRASADIDLTITGDPLDPDIDGRFALTGKEIAVRGLPAPLKDAQARARFTRHKVEIEDLEFSMGPQGSVAASGYANLEQFEPRDFDFSLKALRIPLGSYKEKHGLVDADLKASGTMEKARLTGDLALSELETGVAWRTSKPIDIEAQKEGVDIRSFNLVHRDQTIGMSGTLSFTGTSDLTLTVDNVDIKPLLTIAGVQEEAAGTVDVRARVRGQADSPKIETSLTVRKGSFQSFDLSKIDFKADYEKGALSVNGTVQDAKEGEIKISGTVPADLSLQPARFQLSHKGLDANVQAHNIDLSFLPQFVSAIEKADAKTELNLDLTGDPYEPTIQGKISLEGKEIAVSALPNPIRDLALSASFDRKEFRLSNLDFKVGRAGNMSASGTAQLEGFEPVELNMSVSAKELPLGTSEGVTGFASFDLKAQGPLKELHITGDMAVKGLQEKVWKTAQELSIVVKNDGLDIQSFTLTNNDQSIAASGSLELDGKNDLRLTISHLDIPQTLALAGVSTAPEGTLDADFSVKGSGDAPLINATIQADKITLAPLEPVSFAMKIDYEDKRAAIDGSLEPGGGGGLTIRGVVPIDLALRSEGGRIPSSGMDLKVAGKQVNLAFLAMLTKQLKSLKASMDLDAAIQGNPLKPDLEGSLMVKGDVAALQVFNKPLTDFVINASFDHTSVKLKEVKGSLGANGSIDISGEIGLENLTPTDIQLKLAAVRAPINYERAVKVIINSKMEVTGALMDLNIKGDVNILEGVVYVDRFTSVGSAEGVIVVQTEEDLKSLGKEGEPSQFYQNMAMNISVNGQRDLWARGAGANVEVRTNLQVSKVRGEDIRINGAITTIRGFFDYSGKSFVIQKGTITFIGLEGPDPLLDLIARYEVKDTKIYVNVTGSASKPALILTSDPAMDQSDIIAYLLFGSPVNNLSRSDSNQLQTMAGSFLGGMVGDTMKGILGKEFALDVFQFEGGAGGLEGSAVTLGKYIAPRIFVTFKHKFAQDAGDELQVEYEVTDSISIQSQIGDDQNTGADIIWNYEF